MPRAVWLIRRNCVLLLRDKYVVYLELCRENISILWTTNNRFGLNWVRCQVSAWFLLIRTENVHFLTAAAVLQTFDKKWKYFLLRKQFTAVLSVVRNTRSITDLVLLQHILFCYICRLSKHCPVAHYPRFFVKYWAGPLQCRFPAAISSVATAAAAAAAVADAGCSKFISSASRRHLISSRRSSWCQQLHRENSAANVAHCNNSSRSAISKLSDGDGLAVVSSISSCFRRCMPPSCKLHTQSWRAWRELTLAICPA